MVKKFWGRVCGAGARGVEVVRDAKSSVFGLVAAVMAYVTINTGIVNAADTVTIPDMPVDWADIGTKAAVVLGGVIVGLLGLKIVLQLINVGVRFLGKMLS